MSEYPILFKAEMVNAILDRRKTQTRRVVKPQTLIPTDIARWSEEAVKAAILWRCPYGKPGDTLWVKEPFYYNVEADNYYYTADRKSMGAVAYSHFSGKHANACRAIFLPRKFSRISLPVADVRIERVADITEADAMAEGMNQQNRFDSYHNYDPDMQRYITTMRESFSTLWDSINGKQKPNKPDISWTANPYVWVVTFEVTG